MIGYSQFGASSACLYSYEYNDRTRCQQSVNFPRLAALSSSPRTRRPRHVPSSAAVARSRSQVTHST
ncbi:hypothetical protein PS2_038168 [Malus domestica]